MDPCSMSALLDDIGIRAIPFINMDEQHSGGFFHGFDHDAKFGSHWRVGLF